MFACADKKLHSREMRTSGILSLTLNQSIPEEKVVRQTTYRVREQGYPGGFIVVFRLLLPVEALPV